MCAYLSLPLPHQYKPISQRKVTNQLNDDTSYTSSENETDTHVCVFTYIIICVKADLQTMATYEIRM